MLEQQLFNYPFTLTHLSDFGKSVHIKKKNRINLYIQKVRTNNKCKRMFKK